MLDSLRYRLMRYIPIQHLKKHYEKKYNRLMCNNITKASSEDQYDILMTSDIAKNNNIQIERENFEYIHLNITSVNNSIFIEKNPHCGRINIEITGKNNQVHLGDMSSIIGTLVFISEEIIPLQILEIVG